MSQPPIFYPSPRYQTESPLRTWQQGSESSSQQPFLSPFRTPQYPYEFSVEDQPPPDGIWDPRWTIAQNPNVSDSVQDSGYGSSHRRSKHPPQEMHSPDQYTPASSQSETLLGHDEQLEGGKPQRHESQYRRPSLFAPQLQSPELIHPLPGDEYLTMRPPTPPASNTSLRTYIKKFKSIVSYIKSLPWMEKERCTDDYYPGTDPHSARHLQHRPMIIWHSSDYHGGSYGVFFDDSSVDDESFYQLQHEPIIGTATDLNLLDEFDVPLRHRSIRPTRERAVQVNRRSNPTALDLSREFSTRPSQNQPRYPRGGYVPYEQQRRS